MDELEKSIREKAKAVVEAQEKPTEQSAVDVFNQKLEFRFDTTKPPEEQAKDIIGVKATAKAIEDEDLTKGVTDRKKAEILNHADAHLKKEEAEKDLVVIDGLFSDYYKSGYIIEQIVWC